jgi:hypothetical protein
LTGLVVNQTMKNALRLLLIAGLSTLAACGSTPRQAQWFDKEVTPTGTYHEARFTDSDDLAVRDVLVRLEKLEPSLAAGGRSGDRAEGEAEKITWLLARESQRRGLTRVCEHILWKISTRPVGIHEIYLLDFLTRCQELIFEVGGEDAPLVENLGAFCIRASRRSPFLRVLVDKGLHAHRMYEKHELGRLYGSLVCDILDRVEWGSMNRISREKSTESPSFARSTAEALRKYRERLTR